MFKQLNKFLACSQEMDGTKFYFVAQWKIHGQSLNKARLWSTDGWTERLVCFYRECRPNGTSVLAKRVLKAICQSIRLRARSVSQPDHRVDFQFVPLMRTCFRRCKCSGILYTGIVQRSWGYSCEAKVHKLPNRATPDTNLSAHLLHCYRRICYHGN